MLRSYVTKTGESGRALPSGAKAFVDAVDTLLYTDKKMTACYV